MSLYVSGRVDECQRTLTFLRGSETLAKKEINEYSTNNNTKIDRRLLLRNKVFLITILIITILGIGQQGVGYNAVTFYLQTILEASHTSVKSETASVIIGLVQLSAAFCPQMITDRFGRKLILTITLVGMNFGLVSTISYRYPSYMYFHTSSYPCLHNGVRGETQSRYG